MSISFMIDQLFADPVIGKDAVYTLKDTSVGFPVRVTLNQPDEIVGFGAGQLQGVSTLIDVRVSEVASPQAGDSLTIGSVSYSVQGEPRADRERLVWRLSAYAAAYAT